MGVKGPVVKKPKAKSGKSSVAALLSRISPRTRNTILIGLGSVAVVLAGIWAYYAFTTVPPPVLAQSSAEQVTNYLGNPQGYSRLSIPRREEFLTATYQHYNTPDGREKLNRAVRSMSMQERQVFVDATFDVAREKMMQAADDFHRTPRQDRPRFVDSVIRNVRSLQGDLGGQGNPNMNLGEPFKPLAPERTEDWNKVLFSKTTARDRAKAEPLIDAIAKRVKEQQSQARR